MVTVARLSQPKTTLSKNEKIRRGNGIVVKNSRANMTRGFIYILTNAGIPNVVNIGSTGRHPDDRARELSAGNVPTPFEVCYYAWSEDAAHDAAHLHEFLFDYRNRDTNFFTMSPAQAIQAVESQLNIKRMFITEAAELSLNTEFAALAANRTTEPASAEMAAADTKASDNFQTTAATRTTPTQADALLSEKERIISQAKALETEQTEQGRRRDEQQKIEEAVAFELHQERNRQRALKLHEEHQRQQLEEAKLEQERAKKREQERLELVESEKKKREAERLALEERDKLEEFERRQRAQTKRLSLEKKILRRRQTAAAIKIVGMFLIVAALLGWFWGTHNSAGTSSSSSFFKTLTPPGSTN